MAVIKSIKQLSNFGIFRHYSNTGTQDFGKRNLFYGWNGSGKSTLATLFEAMEMRSLSDLGFEAADFVVLADDGSQIEKNSLVQCRLNIKTFNKNFVEKNIDWDNSVKGILLVAKEKIAEKQELDHLLAINNKAIESIKAKEESVKNDTAEINKFLTDSARRTKLSLQVIDTNDQRYFNYNKTKLEDFLAANPSQIQETASILADDAVAEHTQAARPDFLVSIECPELAVAPEKFTQVFARLKDLIAATATNTAISRLSANIDIQQWVEAGLTLHDLHQGEACEFCGSGFTAERKRLLEGHFNQAFQELQKRLLSAAEWLPSLRPDLSNLPAESALFGELRISYANSVTSLKTANEALINEISVWQDTLQRKTQNQFDTTLVITPVSETVIFNFNYSVKTMLDLIKKHNDKSKDFKKATSQSKNRLELHYAASEAQAFDYVNKLAALAEVKKQLEELKAPLDDQNERIRKLTNSLSNEGVGAEKFNATLHRFLGRSELSLHFKPESSGYEIIRNNAGKHDGRLSEGEKTAIAFVYYVTKLTENNNKLEETIVVVDDPISSFDSNHLFQAYSYLKTECDEVAQLFVLTHNFNFYKLVRDWFEGVNKNRVHKGKSSNGKFYVIESNAESPRASEIKNAEAELIKYQSEYHYLFARLYDFREKVTLSREESYLTANTARKLLEAFFVFKHPKHRSDFAALLIAGQKNRTKTTSDIREKIYRFINKYSHSAVIEVSEDSAENLHGESFNIISQIFEWIQEADPEHYREMCEVVNAAKP
jgi:wobble nucleotide-excising tRNase